MAGFSKNKEALDNKDISLIASSVDGLVEAEEVSNEIGFPVGWGIGRDIAELLGSWWESDRQFIQPSEFLLGPGDKIIASSYSDGPLARIDADDVIKLIGFLERR